MLASRSPITVKIKQIHLNESYESAMRYIEKVLRNSGIPAIFDGTGIVVNNGLLMEHDNVIGEAGVSVVTWFPEETNGQKRV